MEFEKALRALPIEKKARRLRVLWPLIEAKLAEGVSHSAVLELLNRNGLDLTEGTYKMYLHRFRKASGKRLPSPATPTPVARSDPGSRPATFDYDPKGIPDLLK